MVSSERLDTDCIRFSVFKCSRKKIFYHELELLAVVWAVDRFKHYLLGKEFVIATDHKALTSALGEHRSNKTYQSRLTRWVDRLLPFQFKITHIPGRDMGIVDYLSREPNGEPWPESELDERFVVTSIESFHKALDCLNSRSSETNQSSTINIPEHSRTPREINYCKDSSSRGCYDNQFVQNRTKLDRNENGQNSSFQTVEKHKNTLDRIAREKQLVDISKFKDKLNSKQLESKETASSKEMERSETGKSKKTKNKQNGNQREDDQLTEQITETTFSRTRMVKRGAACSRQESDDSDSDIPQVEWRPVRKTIKPRGLKEIQSGNVTGSSGTTLMSFWDLLGAERPDNPKSLIELEARTALVDCNRGDQSSQLNTRSEFPQIIEVDLTAESPSESPEVSMIKKEKTCHDSRKGKPDQNNVRTDISLDNLNKLFDRSLLAELISEDAWMDRLRRVIERNDRYSFELMGPYTNPLWHQLSVVDDCILVDNRLAVPEQLRLAVLKRIHRGHPGQEAMLDVSKYLWWPHMHKDIVNLAEECRSCTRYGKNAKYIIPKNATKPLPLLTQPGQEIQLDYAGPLEDFKGKKIYLLVAIDRYSKFPSVKITKSTGGKSSIKFLRSYIDIHGIPESIRTDQFSGFKGKAMKKFCSDNNIEQKFCPVGDHRGCGLVERTIQTIKRRLGVMLLDENVTSIKLCLSTILRDLRWSKQKTIKMSPFEAHFGRLPKTEFKILSDRFLQNSDRLDKEHLERSALTASQLKKRIDQSRDNLKIVRKGQNSRDVSPLFKEQVDSAKDRERARVLKELLEANARWNQTRRDTSANDLKRTVDETSTINPELRKEMLYSWERGFVEDKPEAISQQRQLSPILIRKDEGRKSGKALTKPLKGRVVAETPSTIKTAAGSVYRKSDIAKVKVAIQDKEKSNNRRSPTGEEPKKKQQRQSRRQSDEQDEAELSQSDEDLLLEQPGAAKEKFQDSPTVITSKDTLQGGGLNLAVRRAKPNLAGPFSKTTKAKVGPISTKDAQQVILQNKSAALAAEVNEPQAPDHACSSNTIKNKKEITRTTSPETILDTFNSKDLSANDWNRLADQVLERGVQRAAAEILQSREDAEDDEELLNPPGFSDESELEETSVRKSGRTKKGPSRYGNPIKHSVKSISFQNNLLDLNQAALEAYRIKLANFKPGASNSVETKFGLLEKHLFRRKFGSEALDITRSWNAEWRIPLQLEEEHEERDGK